MEILDLKSLYKISDIRDRCERCVSDREYWRSRYFPARRNFRSCETWAYNYTRVIAVSQRIKRSSSFLQDDSHTVIAYIVSADQ